MFRNLPNFALAARSNMISPHQQGARAPATSPKGEERELASPSAHSRRRGYGRVLSCEKL